MSGVAVASVASPDSARQQQGTSFLGLTVWSPSEYRQRVGELTVHYGRVESPFGPALLGFSDEGICLLHFPVAGRDDGAIIEHYLPGVRTRVDPAGARRRGAGLFDLHRTGRVLAWAHGTPFQARVWRELATLPLGEVTSYAELAARIGRPGAARAVGTAMARNPLGWLVPCHRVVRSDGSPGLYQGGSGRKVAMLAWERERVGLGDL